ncbi:hypothetical protein K3N28_05775 [Glycomyces sp. TRM65418]|uniref:hypothetical protein n=1 Tax=Glycomyces sp. TRM65418 TaxID=2867006 RepID=UPI001CE5210C|nr:hypothetical protein [Glycomyces sp. TRM65418]MCC3762577.1 hypothetical protein [Glycomyces sp. TRM65418]QZD56616.1 hypothetical protein K3N28_05735 [Glycomyces sp. TRM65418]
MTAYTTIEQAAWTHAARMAATICETDWDTILERLPRLDGYLPGELMAAAARLHLADDVAAATLQPYRAATSLFELLGEEQRRQLTDAEAALRVQGYLHPSRVRLLVEPVQRAVADRHEVRGALADLLYTARTVLEDM